MRRAMSVYLPNWPITRLKRALKGDPRLSGPQGFATMIMAENALRLAAVDEVAAREGAFAGKAMTDALALMPLLRLFEAEPENDARSLEGLARWHQRFSPAVSADAPDGVLLDIDGCAHLWGGERGLAEALRARLAAQDIPARVAIADTVGAAWALARFGEREIEICEGDAGQVLKALPVEALRLDAEVVTQLRRLGLRCIGDVTVLPRVALRKRFGAGLLLQMGRAFGEEEETLATLAAPALWSERRVFAEPLMRGEALTACVRELAETLCARLSHEGLGARRFTAEFYRVDGETGRRVVSMALPAREAKRLVALFAPKIETLDPGFGVEVIVLRAGRVQPLAAAQTDLVAETAAARNADLAPLVDRLRNRLGEERVWRAAPFASHVPERAVTRVEPLAAPAEEGWPVDQPRPVRLFRRPQPIEAVAPVPDDPPLLFRWRGKTHRVRNAEGPERIGAEWWRKAWGENGIDRVRDYYRVEDESGARFWVFRTGLYGHERETRWFLHGLFA